MKIKIDKNGYLEIERAGIMKSQYCPGFDDIHFGLAIGLVVGFVLGVLALYYFCRGLDIFKD